MKKLFTLIAIALMGVANLQAQTVTINKKDGSSVTFETKDIKDIKFVPAASSNEEVYTGKGKIKIGGMFGPYTAESSSYTIVKNADGTINVTVAEEKYKGLPVMGNTVIGTYTVKNIAYDEATKTYSRELAKDGIKVHVKGNTMDKDLDFIKPSKITIKFVGTDSISVNSVYQFTGMPMDIKAEFNGQKK